MQVYSFNVHIGCGMNVEPNKKLLENKTFAEFLGQAMQAAHKYKIDHHWFGIESGPSSLENWLGHKFK